MSNINTEQKLQIVQQIRSQYNQNKYDMSNRERILYHKTTTNEYAPISSSGNESLKSRFALSVIIFIFVILFDFFKINPAGIEMQQIFDVIATDYQENIKSTSG